MKKITHTKTARIIVRRRSRKICNITNKTEKLAFLQLAKIQALIVVCNMLPVLLLVLIIAVIFGFLRRNYS
jgi:hypothetical protein